MMRHPQGTTFALRALALALVVAVVLATPARRHDEPPAPGRLLADDHPDAEHVTFDGPESPTPPLTRTDGASGGEGTPRPYLPGFLQGAVRYTPPAPAVNGDLATLDSAIQRWDADRQAYVADGQGITEVQTNATLEFVVARDVADRYGLDLLERAVAQFNTSPGSRFRAQVVGTTATGPTAPSEDGVWRIFYDDATCRGGDLAWSHLQAAEYDAIYGGRQVAIGELDLGVCRSMAPGDLHATIGHELLHGAGMSHLCNLGESCFRSGMASDNSCRILYPSAHPCQQFGEADARALAYLHPAVPRMSGPTRTETAARAGFILRLRSSAEDVVLVDGQQSPDLAIQAAAFAAAIDAPLLLTNPGQRCTAGPAGQELNRVAAPDASVWLVGPTFHSSCVDDLAGWGLQPLRLANGADIATAMLGGSGLAGLPIVGALARLLPLLAPPDLAVQTILVTRAAINGDSPDALAAAAVAGRLNAPVLYSSGDRLTGQSAQWMAARRSAVPGNAIVVGGVRAVPEAVVTELRALGMNVVRLSGPTRIDTALALARHNPAFGTTRAKVLIAAADRWPDTVTGSAVGGAFGWPVVLVNRDSVPGAVTTYLLNTRAAAVIVGGPGVVSDATQYALSRTVRTLP